MPSSLELQRRKTRAENVVSATSETSRRIICGGLSGMFAKTLFAPLDRVRILNQVGGHGIAVKDQSIIGMCRCIIRREGVIGLWAGNGVNLMRIFPSKGVVFSCNDLFRNQVRYLTKTPKSEKLSGFLSFLAGGLSGMTATIMTYPLDFVRGRISGKLSSCKKSTRHYNGMLNTLSITIKEEGFFAIYKGLKPAAIGAILYEGIKFGTVGFLEKNFPQENRDQKKNTVYRKICFGGLGGVIAGLVMYPNDTVRRMLQLQGSRGTTDVFVNYWDCVQKIYQRHGIRRFYHGLTANLIRMAPNTAIQFGMYEFLKQHTEGFVF